MAQPKLVKGGPRTLKFRNKISIPSNFYLQSVRFTRCSRAISKLDHVRNKDDLGVGGAYWLRPKS